MKINDLSYNATGARYGYNSQEQSTELNSDGNHTTAEFWEYDARSARRWNLDPVDQISKSNYATFANNPIAYNDLNGDCPDCKHGKYEIKKGDTFFDLEKKWEMPFGTLGELNKALDPKKLQIGSEINVTYKANDLPKNITLNSEKTLDGMDRFFKKDMEGVNQLRYINDEDINETLKKAEKEDFYFTHSSNLHARNSAHANFHGGAFDFKKYFLNNIYAYSVNNQLWVQQNTSITEPSSRTLFIYKNYAYNINEFGNLLFGIEHGKKRTHLELLILGGHAYSFIMNWSIDEENEVKAIRRGHNYGKKK